MMAAASLTCSSLSYYTTEVRQERKTYLCPDRVPWLHSTLILNCPMSCDTEKGVTFRTNDEIYTSFTDRKLPTMYAHPENCRQLPNVIQKQA